MANTKKLNETYQFIVEHPDQWNQKDYGTLKNGVKSGCFAFWAVELDPDFAIVFWDFRSGRLLYSTDPGEGYAVVPDIGEIHDIAQHTLELDQHEANELFRASNTLDDLCKIISSLTSVDVAGNTVNA